MKIAPLRNARGIARRIQYFGDGGHGRRRGATGGDGECARREAIEFVTGKQVARHAAGESDWGGTTGRASVGSGAAGDG